MRLCSSVCGKWICKRKEGESLERMDSVVDSVTPIDTIAPSTFSEALGTKLTRCVVLHLIRNTSSFGYSVSATATVAGTIHKDLGMRIKPKLLSVISFPDPSVCVCAAIHWS